MRYLVAALAFLSIAGAAPSEHLAAIEQAAVGETPLLAADTLISAAELLPPGDERRVHLVHRAILGLRGERNNEEARGFYLAAGAYLLDAVDPAEALRLAREAPVRQAVGWRADYRGRAFTFLIGRRPELLEEALRAGAFQVPAAVDHPELFFLLLRNFPGPKARLEDVELLLAAAARVDTAQQTAAVEAALTARGTPDDYEEASIGDVVLKGGMRRAIEIRIGQFLRDSLPEQAARWRNTLPDLESLPAERPEITITRIPPEAPDPPEPAADPAGHLRQTGLLTSLPERLDAQAALASANPQLAGEFLDATLRRFCVMTDFTRHRECAEGAARVVATLRQAGLSFEDLAFRSQTFRARWLLAEWEAAGQ